MTEHDFLNTPSEKQVNSQNQMRHRYGCADGVSYGVKDAVKIVFGGNEDRCICCGEIVPEGTQVCYKCQHITPIPRR